MEARREAISVCHISLTVCRQVLVVRTSRAVTILGRYPERHVQVILKIFKSPAEVLIGFDVDSVRVQRVVL